MPEPDDVWQQLNSEAERLTALSTDTVEVWACRKRRLHRVIEGLDAGDNWVYGLEEPVRWRWPFGSRRHLIQPVERAASRIETFLRERPDLAKLRDR